MVHLGCVLPPEHEVGDELGGVSPLWRAMVSTHGVNVHGNLLFRCIFPGQCTLKLITLTLRRTLARSTHSPMQ